MALSPKHQTANSLDLNFGLGKHLCPAMKYSWNSMRLIMAELPQQIEAIQVVDVPMPVNDRLVTFPIQPRILVNYKKSATSASRVFPVRDRRLFLV